MSQYGSIMQELCKVLESMDFVDGFRKLKQITGAKTQSQVALMLGISRSAISHAKKRRRVPVAWILRCITKYSINPIDFMK